MAQSLIQCEGVAECVRAYNYSCYVPLYSVRVWLNVRAYNVQELGSDYARLYVV